MEEDIYEKIVSLRRKGILFAIATIIARAGATPRKDNAKMLIDENGNPFGSIGGGAMEAEVIRAAGEIIRSGDPRRLTFDLTDKDPEENEFVCAGHMEVYVEPIMPDPSLFIFGTGNVGKALADVASFAGFRVVIVDDRKKYTTVERFPRADEFYVDSWDNILNKMEMNSDSYIFISTRDHTVDESCLKFALKSSARYIGILGNLKKIELLEECLKAEGKNLSQLTNVSVPVGLDLGAESPEEIAISIAAEMIAARKNRDVTKIKNAVHNAASCLTDRLAN